MLFGIPKIGCLTEKASSHAILHLQALSKPCSLILAKEKILEWALIIYEHHCRIIHLLSRHLTRRANTASHKLRPHITAAELRFHNLENVICDMSFQFCSMMFWLQYRSQTMVVLIQFYASSFVSERGEKESGESGYMVWSKCTTVHCTVHCTVSMVLCILRPSSGN